MKAMGTCMGPSKIKRFETFPIKKRLGKYINCWDMMPERDWSFSPHTDTMAQMAFHFFPLNYEFVCV